MNQQHLCGSEIQELKNVMECCVFRPQWRYHNVKVVRLYIGWTGGDLNMPPTHAVIMADAKTTCAYFINPSPIGHLK